MKLIFFGFLLFIFLNSEAQTQYQPLKSEGKVPKEVFEDILKTYDKRVSQHKGEDNLKLKKDFYIKHLYSISKVFENGDILFGDELSLYVNDVAAKVLSMFPEIEHDVKVFVSKDYTVNAYSTQKGVLFVNMGLIAQVENEAQLAFVLAHELIHYAKNHGIERYVEKETLKKSRIGVEKNYFQFISYAKEQEFEADLLAITDIYLKLGYDINEALKTFDVLLYSYLPFDEIHFKAEIFEDEYFKLPEEVTNVSKNPITAVEDYNDTNSTHPNIKKRRANIYDEIANIEVPDSGAIFLISEDRFKKAQKIARYEVCQLYLNDANYGKALYSSYLLKLEDTNNLYLDRVFTYSLYALSKYRNYLVDRETKRVEYLNSNPYIRKAYEKDEDVGKFVLDGVEGNSSVLYKIINNLDDDALNILALKNVYETHLKYPDDSFMQKLLEDIIYDLVIYHDYSFDDFKNTENIIVSADTLDFKEISEEEYNALTKYQKIKYDKKKALHQGNNDPSRDYKLLAMANHTEDSLLIKHFNISESVTKLNNLLDNSVISVNENKENRKIDKVVIINPTAHYRNYISTNYFKTMKLEDRLESSLDIAKKHIDMDIVLLKSSNLYSADIEDYNDISIIMSYYMESFNHLSVSDNFRIIPSNLAYVDNLREKYDTDNFSFAMLFDNMINYYSRYVDYYFVNFDFNTGLVTYLNNNKLKTRSYQHILNSIIYNSVFDLKHGINPKN